MVASQQPHHYVVPVVAEVLPDHRSAGDPPDRHASAESQRRTAAALPRRPSRD